MNYKQARDKIIDAYFKNEIRPMDAEFCICGTLTGNKGWACKEVWERTSNNHGMPEDYPYTVKEYIKIENALLNPLIPFGIRIFNFLEREKYTNSFNIIMPGLWRGNLNIFEEGYEDALFQGMSDALDVLKEIHRSRGEDVDEELVIFTKRQLVNQ